MVCNSGDVLAVPKSQSFTERPSHRSSKLSGLTSQCTRPQTSCRNLKPASTCLLNLSTLPRGCLPMLRKFDSSFSNAMHKCSTSPTLCTKLSINIASWADPAASCWASSRTLRKICTSLSAYFLKWSCHRVTFSATSLLSALAHGQTTEKTPTPKGLVSITVYLPASVSTT